ncbi:MAG: histidine phosphatase family protein [Candidatus Aenigmatarchaeota archaeon]
MKRKLVFIFRHPIWDKKNDKPLKDTYKQTIDIIQFIKENIKNDNLDIVFTSPTKRCLFLAKAISLKFKAKIFKTSLLKERNEGVYKLLGENAEKVLEYKSKKIHYCEYRPIFGESIISVIRRTKKFIIKYLKNLSNKNIVIITHYTNVLTFYSLFTKKDIKYVWDYEDFLENGAIGFFVKDFNLIKSKIKLVYL